MGYKIYYWFWPYQFNLSEYWLWGGEKKEKRDWEQDTLSWDLYIVQATWWNSQRIYIKCTNNLLPPCGKIMHPFSTPIKFFLLFANSNSKGIGEEIHLLFAVYKFMSNENTNIEEKHWIKCIRVMCHFNMTAKTKLTEFRLLKWKFLHLCSCLQRAVYVFLKCHKHTTYPLHTTRPN